MGRTMKMVHASLGLSLVKKKKPEWNRATNSEHIVQENATTALKSVTEENSYDEFIATAQLANKEFTAEKLNVKFVALSAVRMAGNDDGDREFTEEEKARVVVPRRPKWTREMSAEELDEAEREAFLNWRRAMAQLQNKEGITPFERNIQVWRQLWRVVEKSEIIVQIVDARDPLLYRCEDLEAYGKEMGKQNVLLINKADYLTGKQRKCWDNYLTSINLPHAFYSAVFATLTLSKSKPESDIEEEGSDGEGSSSGDGDEVEVRKEDSDEQGNDEKSTDEDSDDQNHHFYRQEHQDEDSSLCPILSREELIEFLRSFKKKGSELVTVGLVGYPNVGKSSTINSLMAAKKTSVSATPGKTKHFQTLYLDEDILLCDCPGLVMPAFGGSKGEMVLGGILPIDQLTNYHAAVSLLVQRIPLARLRQKYGVSLPLNYTHDDFLNNYASLRGFMTVRGLPDCSRASRIVLKDFVTGKLCFCKAPPSECQEEFQPFNRPLITLQGNNSGPPVSKEKRPLEHRVKMENVLDRQFFKPAISTAHYKGKHQISSGISSSTSNSNLTNSTGEAKSWKKHGNKNKREKLRRVYRHLDVE